MLVAIILILAVLWILGYLNLQALHIPTTTLFVINGQPITLWDLLILLVIAWAVGVLPSPFRLIASVLLLLWVLSVLNIIAVPGLASILVITIVVGLIVSLFIPRGPVVVDD